MLPTKSYLEGKYLAEKLSAKDISIELKCSENKIHYWLKKYKIKKRTIREATYIKSNPQGDPFKFSEPVTKNDWFMYGLGLGLYWGEGNKANKHAIRLGNTDPALIKLFIEFLSRLYNIDTDKLRFGLQIFTDIKPNEALEFWSERLNIKRSQFHKPTITQQNKTGTYRKKIQHGVLTVYFSNRKLRDIIICAIEKLQREEMPM